MSNKPKQPDDNLISYLRTTGGIILSIILVIFYWGYILLMPLVPTHWLLKRIQTHSGGPHGLAIVGVITISLFWLGVRWMWYKLRRDREVENLKAALREKDAIIAKLTQNQVKAPEQSTPQQPTAEARPTQPNPPPSDRDPG